MSLREEVIYEIFINIDKYYNALYRYRYLDILKECGMGTQYLRLLLQYWDLLVMMARSSRYHEENLKGYRGVTKVYPISPDILNFGFYEVIYHWVMEVSGEESIPDGVGREADQMVTFLYADNSLMGSTG